MGTVPVYVGLDYHSRSVQVDGDGRVLVNRRCGNSLAAVAGVVRGRGGGGELLRCGGPGRVSAGAGVLAGDAGAPGVCPADEAQPGQERLLRRADAGGAVAGVPAVWLAPSWVRDLRMLVRLRADLVGRIRAIKTRILGVVRVPEPACPGRWTLGWLDGQAELNEAGRFVVRTHPAQWRALVAQVKGVESRLGALTADDRVAARLLEHRGVGKVTAWTMRAMIGDFGRFASGEQLARFCAVTPRNASSGERVADAGLIRAGDPLLKSVLIEAAHRLRRREPRWSAFSAGLSARGKPVSVAAIANRWVRWLYHQMKEGDRPAATAA